MMCREPHRGLTLRHTARGHTLRIMSTPGAYTVVKLKTAEKVTPSPTLQRMPEAFGRHACTWMTGHERRGSPACMIQLEHAH